MARVSDLLAAGRTCSFEFFPPKTDGAQLSLGRTIAELEPLAPSFVSVTYGAGGSSRARTRDVVAWVRKETSITPMAHLTCQGHTRAEIAEILADYRDAGIENILALGGDLPGDPAEHRPSDYTYASDLIDDIAAADFSIGVAVFEAEHYLRLVDELAALGVDKPVVPGIMPVTNAGQIRRMAELSGAAVPGWLVERLDASTDADEVRRIGVDVATELCAELLQRGAPGLHLYTLNRSTASREIYTNLGLGATLGAPE